MKSGQSLIELLIALGIFGVTVSVVTFLLINGYLSDLQARQNNIAIFLAEEGLETVRSIRDNNWKDLKEGSYGLAIAGNHWILTEEPEDISAILNQGKRKIKIENIDKERKKITSEITWQIAPIKKNKIELVTYLTNWQKEIQ